MQLSSHYYHDVKWGRREVLRGWGENGDKRSRGRLGMGINFRKYAGTGWGWGQRVRGRLGWGQIPVPAQASSLMYFSSTQMIWQIIEILGTTKPL